MTHVKSKIASSAAGLFVAVFACLAALAATPQPSEDNADLFGNAPLPPVIAGRHTFTGNVGFTGAATMLGRSLYAAPGDNLLVNQPLAVSAWANSTKFMPGDIASANGANYEEMQNVNASPIACTSASSGSGPTGTAQMQTDNNCRWSPSDRAAAGNAPTIIWATTWATGTTYPANASVVVVTSGVGALYTTTAGGVAGATAPTGTGAVSDGGVSWVYQRSFPTNTINAAAANSFLWNGGAGALMSVASANGGTLVNNIGNGYAWFQGPTQSGTQFVGVGRLEFATDAPTVVFRSYNYTAYPTSMWRFAVCGAGRERCRWVNINHSGPSVAGYAYTFIDFTAAGGRAPRDLIVEYNGGTLIGGFDIQATDDVYPPSGPPIKILGLISDSYGGGTGEGSAANSFGQYIADMLGIRGFVSTAIGGCGYSAIPSCASGPAISRINDVFQIANGAGPDYILLSLGTNDITNGLTPAQIAAGQMAEIAALRQQLRHTPIFVVGIFPHNGGGTSCGSCVATETAEQQAIAALGDREIAFCPFTNDPAGPYESGTGTIAAQNGTGNTDYTLQANGHPNPFGMRKYAARIVGECIRPWLNANGN